jgi:dTDP-4-amino-4,6-dideoxygalactose transaminase
MLAATLGQAADAKIGRSHLTNEISEGCLLIQLHAIETTQPLHLGNWESYRKGPAPPADASPIELPYSPSAARRNAYMFVIRHHDEQDALQT